MLLIGMCTSLTKKPTKPAFGVARVATARRRRGSVVLVLTQRDAPMIRKPIIVADAIRANSFLSGFVHFLTR